MEVRVRERLVGALVLVAIVVLLVPSVLKGRDPPPPAVPEQAPSRVVMPVGPEKSASAEEVLVPEPDLPTEPASAGVETPPQSKPPVADAGTTALPPEEPPAALPQSATPGAARVEAPAWAVQLGAFSNRDKADGLVAQLRRRGYAAFVLEYRASGKVLYRVRVGPEQDRARAEEIATRLGKDGFQTIVARHP